MPARLPRLIVVGGGKGGVGTTTVAVNLAVMLARDGLRTMLIDADPHGGDVSFLCGLEDRYTLADVLTARRSIAAALHAGPGDVQVLPGVGKSPRPADAKHAVGARLLDHLPGLCTHAHVVVLDGGNSPNPMLRGVWRAAQLVLMVSSPETASILGAYAAIKDLVENEQPGAIHALVNLAPDAETAARVHARLAQACRRFFGAAVGLAGHVPPDPCVPAAACVGTPLAIAAPDSQAAQHVQRLAARMAAKVCSTSFVRVGLDFASS